MGRELLIGATVAPGQGERVSIDANLLTTHGVVLGMTGSGKTGMAVVLLEELARQGVPLLVCDLKGDLTNLLLTFPDLQASDFLPYLPESAAGDRQAAAEVVAERWRQGLAPWGLGEQSIRELRSRVAWQLLTPGSGLAPVDLLPALEAPEGYDPDLDPDGARSRLDGTVGGLLALVGRGGDPMVDRDHVLLATLLDTAWRRGGSLDLPTLVRQVSEPPVTRFGVLDTETFYPRRERAELVQALNVVLASPSFAAWTRGVPLAVSALAGTAAAPRASILYLAHLGERERLSFLTLLFSTLLSWARSQPGTDSLRLLLYLDEVQGILPPVAVPPTKPPLLTLLKQGRAFGAGVLLATQNPVDLDYKALGNMGLKLLGRLDTENDRRRALEGLDMAGEAIEQTVGGLQPRQFVLSGARVGAPRVVSSRWAMSYLRGPLTLPELKPLVGARPATVPAPAAPAVATAVPLLPGVEQLFADGAELDPAVMVEGRVVYRKASPAVQREASGPWVVPLGPGGVSWDGLRTREVPPLQGDPPEGARLGELPPDAAKVVKDLPKSFGREVAARPLQVRWHRALKLVQEEGETDETFRRRCEAAAREGSQAQSELVRQRHAEKVRTLELKLSREQLELARDQQDLAARERQARLTAASGVGDTILSGLGALFGRRSGISSAVRRGASAARQYSERQRMTDRARAEVEESEQAIAAFQQERERLDAELGDELLRVEEETRRLAQAVETLPLTPAARDVAVHKVTLVWLPPDALR